MRSSDAYSYASACHRVVLRTIFEEEWMASVRVNRRFEVILRFPSGTRFSVVVTKSTRFTRFEKFCWEGDRQIGL